MMRLVWHCLLALVLLLEGLGLGAAVGGLFIRLAAWLTIIVMGYRNVRQSFRRRNPGARQRSRAVCFQPYGTSCPVRWRLSDGDDYTSIYYDSAWPAVASERRDPGRTITHRPLRDNFLVLCVAVSRIHISWSEQ